MATAFGSTSVARTARARFLGRRGFSAGGFTAAMPQAGEGAAVPGPAISATDGRRSAWRDTLYVMLHALGLAGTTLLMTWGALVLFFVVLGGFSTDGLMHQLNNMAGRYVAADGERIASFKQILLWTQFLLFAAILFFRRGSIVPAQWTANHV